MSSPYSHSIDEGSPVSTKTDEGSSQIEQRDSPSGLGDHGNKWRSLVRNEKKPKGHNSASVLVGSVRIKAEFDDFSYGDACSVSPKVLAERAKYRNDDSPSGSRVKEEPMESGSRDPCMETSKVDVTATTLASSAYQLAQIPGQESIGNFGMWSHKKFGIGGYLQYGSTLTRGGDAPGSPKTYFSRTEGLLTGAIRSGLPSDSSPDSGNSTESRKSGNYKYNKMVVKMEKSPSPKCDSILTKMTPVQSPEEMLSPLSWTQSQRSKSCSPDNRERVELPSNQNKNPLRSLHSEFEPMCIYPCRYCDEAFSLYTALQEHIRLEHSDDPLPKSVEFSRVHNTIPHSQDARSSSSYSEGSDGNKYTCKFCSLGFEFYTVLQEHIRIAHDGGRRSSTASTTSAKLASSVSPVVVDGPAKYPCKHCEESFPLYTALQEHIRIEHGENAYWGRAAYMSVMMEGREELFEEMMTRCDCQFCPEKFATPLLLQEHVRVQHVAKWALQKSLLQIPIPVNNSELPAPPAQAPPTPPPAEPSPEVKNPLKKYVCAICGKEYGNKLRYQVHCKSHVLEEEKVEKKQEVERKPEVPKLPVPVEQPPPTVHVPVPASANSDASVNIEDLRYVCEVCNARFPLYVVMQEHIRTAHGDKPFKCDLCEKEFIKRNYLMKHMKAHAEAKAQVLKCQKCDRCFMDQARLKEHAKEHTNEGRYKCQMCGSCFTHKMHHDQHVRTHSGEKPFKCSECGKQFSQPGPFHNHLRSHARCAYCNRTFLEKSALLLHLKAEHGQKVPESESNRSSPVSSVPSCQNLNLLSSSLIPLPVRLPETEFLSTSPNEPLNLSKNCKESPLRITPVSFQSGSHMMSPVLFPGLELYTDVISSLNTGQAMSVASSNSNTSSLNDLSRPSSAKSETYIENRLSKLEPGELRRSPGMGKEELCRLKVSPRTPGQRSESSDIGNGSDSDRFRGSLSVDFLSTSSHDSNAKIHVEHNMSLGNFTHSISSPKCAVGPLPKTISPNDKLLNSDELFKYSDRKTGYHFTSDVDHFGLAKKRCRVSEREEIEMDSIRGQSQSGSGMHGSDRSLSGISHSSEGVGPSSKNDGTMGSDDTSDGESDALEIDESVENEIEGSPDSDLDDYVSYVCGFCTEVFPNMEQMETHDCQIESLDHKENPTEAVDPSSNLPDDDTKNATPPCGKRLYRCQSCSKVFWEEVSLREHLRLHDDVTTATDRGQHYSCDQCDRTYSTSRELYNHLQSHAGLRHHECPICCREFIMKCHLVVHMAVHSDERPHPCPECGKCFKIRTSLLQHIKTHSNLKPYNCPVCNMKFTFSGQMQQHMKIHAAVKQYSCKFCDKTFARNGQLQQHLRIHTNSRPFQCEFCDKSFTCSQALQQHTRIHTGVKPYTCTYCGKGFVQNGQLHQHVRKHTGEKPFTCKDCHRSFGRKEQLQKHMKNHIEKPFQCGRCHERFGDTNELQVHVDGDACGKIFMCPVCHKRFTKNNQLKCHLKTHEELGVDVSPRNDSLPSNDVLPSDATSPRNNALPRDDGLLSNTMLLRNDGFRRNSTSPDNDTLLKNNGETSESSKVNCDTPDNHSDSHAVAMTINQYNWSLCGNNAMDSAETDVAIKREAILME